MKIKINKSERRIPTLRDVKSGDLFVDMRTGDLYVKTTHVLIGSYECISIRNGQKINIAIGEPIRLVHSIVVEADDYPKSK